VSFTGWDETLLTEMVAFCHFCEEEIPGDLEVGCLLHPAMLLHWRVQGAAVGFLGRRNRDVYQNLLSNRRVRDAPLYSFPVRGRPETSRGKGAKSGEGSMFSELRSDPDFSSGVPLERKPRWDESPGRATPPHPGNILIIEDDSSSFGDDPLADDPLANDFPGVGRIRTDTVGEEPNPFEPFGEGFPRTPGSWGDRLSTPPPTQAREEGDPYFPTSPGSYEDLGATGGSDVQARAPAGAGPGREEGTGVSGGPG
jgi:hypothetical protein